MTSSSPKSSGSSGAPGQPGPGSAKRRFVGVLFECCKVYVRVYLDPGKSAHVGWCPRCGGKIELIESPTGSTKHFFNAR